jgi:hypothetical protein
MKSFKEYRFNEEVSGPTNTVGSGNIAGVGQPVDSKFGEPGGSAQVLNKKNILKRKDIVEAKGDEFDVSLATELFKKCREASTETHLIHLNSGSYAEHIALKEFYDGIIPLIDAFCESFIGRSDEKLEDDNDDPIEVIEDLRDWIDKNRNEISNDSELQNSIDTIVEQCNSSLYKLRNLE